MQSNSHSSLCNYCGRLVATLVNLSQPPAELFLPRNLARCMQSNSHSSLHIAHDSCSKCYSPSCAPDSRSSERVTARGSSLRSLQQSFGCVAHCQSLPCQWGLGNATAASLLLCAYLAQVTANRQPPHHLLGHPPASLVPAALAAKT